MPPRTVLTPQYERGAGHPIRPHRASLSQRYRRRAQIGRHGGERVFIMTHSVSLHVRRTQFCSSLTLLGRDVCHPREAKGRDGEGLSRRRGQGHSPGHKVLEHGAVRAVQLVRRGHGSMVCMHRSDDDDEDRGFHKVGFLAIRVRVAGVRCWGAGLETPVGEVQRSKGGESDTGPGVMRAAGMVTGDSESRFRRHVRTWGPGGSARVPTKARTRTRTRIVTAVRTNFRG